jgi:prepilin-type N-terminal cleavage/methylation domain-containing protein
MERLMKAFWRKKRGFTLIELLIVVAIIGVLAGIAIPNFLGARTRARVARSVADMDAIGKGEELYFVDNLEYTATTSDLTDGDYIAESTLEDPWTRPYHIYTSGDPADKYLVTGDCVDETQDITSGDISWSAADRVRGALGGAEGSHEGYGVTDEWYDPADGGVNSTGDIGYGSG